MWIYLEIFPTSFPLMKITGITGMLSANTIQFNSILYSDCQIHFSASTKHLINDKLPKQLHSDVTHGIATTKRNMTLTSFDVVSTLLFYL